jgi:hypothetical protein
MPNLRQYDLFEIKCATFLIGLVQIGVGLAVFGPRDSIFVQTLTMHNLAPHWAFVLISVGAWTLTTAFMPCRSIRHHALVLSWATLWGTFAMFVFWGKVTLPAALLWVHGTAALVTFIVDVHAYDRARKRARAYDGSVSA